jgi:drug/metabolite transporter (DMT)-like permease
MRRLHADLLLLAAAAIWGLAFVFQKTAMAVIGPLTFIAARSIVATLALAPFAWQETRRNPAGLRREVLHVAAAGGLAFFVAAAFQQYGLITATVTNAGFLTALYVVIVPFVTWVWHRKVPNAIVWTAATISFIGIWLLGGATVGALSRGDILIIICAVFWALHLVVTARASEFDRPMVFTCVQFIVVALLALVGAGFTETVTLAQLQLVWLEIAYVGLLSSALTFALLTIALRHAPPAEAAVLVSTENLFSALAGAWLLGERLEILNWLGASLILVATLGVQLAPFWSARKSARPQPVIATDGQT